MASNKQRPPKRNIQKPASKPEKAASQVGTEASVTVGGGDARAQHKQALLGLQRATRRPRPLKAGDDGESSGGRLFVNALARGLEVLSAFRADDLTLGNLENALLVDACSNPDSVLNPVALRLRKITKILQQQQPKLGVRL